jgi:hypothetical protein
MPTSAAPSLERRLYPPTELRIYRLERNVKLIEASAESGIPPARGSVIERWPAAAKTGEIDRWRSAVDRVAERLSRG